MLDVARGLQLAGDQYPVGRRVLYAAHFPLQLLLLRQATTLTLGPMNRYVLCYHLFQTPPNH